MSTFTRVHWTALAVFGAVLAATWWRPQWPVEQALHHSLTAIALVGLVLVQRRWPLPASSFVLLLAFLTLHTVAARWIYSYVPYDDWSQAVFGTRLPDLLGWQRNNFGGANPRNNFDRLVHLAYGLCFAPVLFRFFTDRRGWRRGWAALAAVDIIISTGALYELFEWGIAATLAPDYAEAYNGQQGDAFDAQKDMAIAAVGALVATGLALLFPSRRPPPAPTPVPVPVPAAAPAGQ